MKVFIAIVVTLGVSDPLLAQVSTSSPSNGQELSMQTPPQSVYPRPLQFRVISSSKRLPDGRIVARQQAVITDVPLAPNGRGEYVQTFPGSHLRITWIPERGANGQLQYRVTAVLGAQIPNSSGNRNFSSGFSSSDPFSNSSPNLPPRSAIPPRSFSNTSPTFSDSSQRSLTFNNSPSFTDPPRRSTNFSEPPRLEQAPSFQRSFSTDPPPVSSAPSRPQFSKFPIRIECPDWVSGIGHYDLITANGQRYHYTIRGGEKQIFNETTKWSIAYDPGDGRPTVTYPLRGGSLYEFRQDGNSWGLYMHR